MGPAALARIWPRPVAAALIAATSAACGSGAEGLPPAAGPTPLAHSTAAQRPALITNAYVVWVTDGDTLTAHVSGQNYSVRLDGINAPEKRSSYREPECYGEQASDYLKALLPKGTRLRLERTEQLTDKYDRLIAYVYRSEDGLFINAHMVAVGLADAAAYGTRTTYDYALSDAEVKARQASLGKWGAC